MQSIIERLKQNKEAFGLMDEELKRVAEKLNPDSFEVWIDGAWRPTVPVMGGKLSGNFSYRLRADYQCQHIEHNEGMTDHEFCGHPATVCAWCNAEIPQEKKAGWVECKIEPKNGVYQFVLNGTNHLGYAPGMVGFGGIKYEEPESKVTTRDFLMVPPNPVEQYGPWKPVSVRFWKEPTK